VHHQHATIQEITQLWRTLKDLGGRGGARKWDERERRKKETVRRFTQAREKYMEVRDGLASVILHTSRYLPLIFANSKGLQFYSELSGLLPALRRDAKDFVSSRKSERDSLVAQLETQQRLSAPGTSYASPPPKPPPAPSSLNQVLSSLSLKSIPGPTAPPAPTPPPAPWTSAQKAAYTGHPSYPPPPPQSYPPPSPPTSQGSPFIPPPPGSSQLSNVPSSTRPPYPPPPVQSPYGVAPLQPQRDPYAGLASLAGAAHYPMPPPQRQASYLIAGQQQGQAYQSLPPPARTMYTYSATPPLPGPVRQDSAGPVLPPPPPPVSYSQPPPPQSYNVGVRSYGVPPPPGQQQPYGGYGQYGR